MRSSIVKGLPGLVLILAALAAAPFAAASDTPAPSAPAAAADAVSAPAAAPAPATAPVPPERALLEQQVGDAERAFAKSMADRDFEAFKRHLSQETVFFMPRPTRGAAEVAAAWKKFYEKPEAPFSWAPDTVQVLDSGTLALTSGPVHDPAGKLVGSFTSIWRLEAPGTWRIIFDKGCDVCEECPRP